jgi:hypothetical protein
MLLLFTICFGLLSSSSYATIVATDGIQLFPLVTPTSIATVNDLISATQPHVFDEVQCHTVTKKVFCTNDKTIFIGARVSSHLLYYWEFLNHGQIEYGPFRTTFDQPIVCILGGPGQKSLESHPQFDLPLSAVTYPNRDPLFFPSNYNLEAKAEAIVDPLDPNTIIMEGAIVAANPDVIRVLTFCPPEVQNNNPPDCSAAVPVNSEALIFESWPPNGEMVEVSVQVPDSDLGDTVTITYDRVFQSETTKSKNSDNCPDAEITLSGDAVRVRLERLDPHDGAGRSYTIEFTASDNHGNACSGTVTLCLAKNDPKNNGKHDNCDLAAPTTHDSTICDPLF